MEKVNKTFKELTGMELSSDSFLNMFDILKDDSGNYMINIFKSYIVNENILQNPDLFHLYSMKDDDWWDRIAHKYYGSSKLWWVITLVNNIHNPFEDYEETDTVKILKRIYLYDIIKSIKKMREL